MVETGVTVELNKATWMDRAGSKCSEAIDYGCKVTHKIIRPDMCICGDECGKLLPDERVCVPQEKSSTRNRRFPMIGFTIFTSTGDPGSDVCIDILREETKWCYQSWDHHYSEASLNHI